MANQVVGTGSVEIIFNYEKNLKNMLSNVKKEWDKVDISKRLDGIDKSLNKLNKTTNDNTKVTNDNSKAQKSKNDITEILKKTLSTKSLLITNNLNPQLAIDSLLIFINRTYTSLANAKKRSNN